MKDEKEEEKRGESSEAIGPLDRLLARLAIAALGLPVPVLVASKLGSSGNHGVVFLMMVSTFFMLVPAAVMSIALPDSSLDKIINSPLRLFRGKHDLSPQ